MKKFYESPSAEIELFAIGNILTTSTPEGLEENGDSVGLNYLNEREY